MGVLIRLDCAPSYGEIVKALRHVDGELLGAVCREIIDQTRDKDPQRQAIRQTAIRLMDRDPPGPRDQAMYEYMRDEHWTRKQILDALERTSAEIPATHGAIIGLLFRGQ